jgi:anthranilate phosphoribosyltransferase
MGRHDIEVRKRAAELIDSGAAYKTLEKVIAVSNR